MKLVLFDIDGTILWSDGAGRRAMEGALRAAFGTTGASGYRYDGKTDRQIVRELMRGEGFDDVEIDRRVHEVLDDYVARLHVELSSETLRAKRYDGVLELIDAVEQHAGQVLGLLTGNVAPGAHAKLRAVGIAPERFVIGAFGSDHEVRGELPGVAIRRAKEQLGLTVPGDRVVIIGDTPSDIDCGRAVGARAIAVATGRYTVDDLATHQPFAVFQDLSDTHAVMRAIEEA